VLTMIIFAGLAGCGQKPSEAPSPPVAAVFAEFDLTTANYPRIDGSTSALPIQRMLACRLFAAPHRWTHSETTDERSLMASDLYEEFENKNYRGEKRALCEYLNHLTQHQGTHQAWVNLIEGRADFILVARQASDDELALAKRRKVELDAQAIARDAFVFLINEKNPVRKLTLAQIRGIYAGKLKKWREVGGNDAPIQAYQRTRNSGSQDMMRKLVMKGERMIEGPDVLVETLMASTILRIYTDPNGIAYSFYFYKELMADRPEVWACAVNGVVPTAATIRSGEYPLVTEVYAVLRKDTSDNHPARRLRGFLLSAEGQKIVEEAGYVGLDRER
jgi:phosphate transport system substrate-binding protein